MKALCIATTLALLGGSAAHAGTILDTAIGGSDARLKVEDCGNDTCGTFSFGKQKFVVKKSDISSFFKDLDLGDKPSPAKQRDKPAATDNRAGPTGAAPAARPEDRNASSSRRDEPAAIRSDDRPAPRWDETPGPAQTARPRRSIEGHYRSEDSGAARRFGPQQPDRRMDHRRWRGPGADHRLRAGPMRRRRRRQSQ